MPRYGVDGDGAGAGMLMERTEGGANREEVGNKIFSPKVLHDRIRQCSLENWHSWLDRRTVPRKEIVQQPAT